MEPVVTHQTSWLESTGVYLGWWHSLFLSFLFFSFDFFTWASGVHSVDRPGLSHALRRVQVHQIKGVISHLNHKLWVRDAAGGVVSTDLDAVQSSCCLSNISIALQNKCKLCWFMACALLYTALCQTALGHGMCSAVGGYCSKSCWILMCVTLLCYYRWNGIRVLIDTRLSERTRVSLPGDNACSPTREGNTLTSSKSRPYA